MEVDYQVYGLARPADNEKSGSFVCIVYYLLEKRLDILVHDSEVKTEGDGRERAAFYHKKAEWCCNVIIFHFIFLKIMIQNLEAQVLL